MKIDQLNKLNNFHLDVIKEISNIASGNAATSLATMLNFKIDMAVPQVQVVKTNHAATLLGGPENIKVGILAKIFGDIEGLMMFLLEESFAKDIMQSLLGQDYSFQNQMDEMQYSVISEIGNIMIASYVNAISNMTGMHIDISVPSIAIDMVGALLAVPALELSPASDDIIFVEGVFLDRQSDVTSNILLVPTIESLNTLLIKLGIEL
ncbi:MAG: chemotaxis protein CheC [Oscillospiraceae bacterium]